MGLGRKENAGSCGVSERFTERGSPVKALWENPPMHSRSCGWLGVTLVPAARLAVLLLYILSWTLLSLPVSDFLICKLGLLITVSHNLVGLLKGRNELVSAVWHIARAEFIIDIKLRDAVEKSVSYALWKETVYATLRAEAPLSADWGRKRAMSGGPCREEVQSLWGSSSVCCSRGGH